MSLMNELAHEMMEASLFKILQCTEHLNSIYCSQKENVDLPLPYNVYLILLQEEFEISQIVLLTYNK